MILRKHIIKAIRSAAVSNPEVQVAPACILWPNHGCQWKETLATEALKKNGASVLCDKTNITWNKDRGKDVESAPWYHLFNGDRINDQHLILAEKQTARETLE